MNHGFVVVIGNVGDAKTLANLEMLNDIFWHIQGPKYPIPKAENVCKISIR